MICMLPLIVILKHSISQQLIELLILHLKLAEVNILAESITFLSKESLLIIKAPLTQKMKQHLRIKRICLKQLAIFKLIISRFKLKRFENKFTLLRNPIPLSNDQTQFSMKLI